MINTTRLKVLGGAVLAAVLWSCSSQQEYDSGGWSEYLGGPDRNHYSSLEQITPENVKNLTVAWEYHTLDTGQIQCNPIVVNGILYGVTASNGLFAVDAATGKELWKFWGGSEKSVFSNNRGITYWAGDKEKHPVRLMYSFGEWLYAVNAETGEKITSFGEEGRVSLKSGLGENAQDKFVISTTPGTLFEDKIIMPLRVSEGADAAPGYIQAFNVITGKADWVFHTIPHPGEFGHDTWPEDAWKNTEIGAANNWAGMAVDRKRGIVYVPTGSAGFDFYGGNRKGSNLFANCLLALDARTGKRKWHYQFVHHDIWDRDLPAPPNLLTIRKNGKKTDVVAQVTKSGHVFMFDRVTGEPVFPIDEVPVPASVMEGEEAWPTQPVPRLPLPFARQQITEADLNTRSANYDSVLATYRSAIKGAFVPLSKTPSLLFPGADGGAEWGGAAADKEGVLYVNANEMAWLFSLSDTPKEDELAHLSPGEKTYVTLCAACHGKDLQGNPASGYPSLLNISNRMKRPEVLKLISNGKGMMPGFSAISAAEKEAVIAFIFGEEKKEVTGNPAKPASKKPYVPYKFNGYHKFLNSEGYPAISPPWGTLTAIDLNTGKHKWQIPLGEFKELTEKGIPPTGTENYGGPVVTQSGLLFIAASKDGMFRAFDKNTGRLLWQAELPAPGFATPATYEINGKQYIVIAAGGTKLGTKKGDSYVAFALPDPN
ncbi:PQQ-binding-like beta-propeller repeat protein [Leadbetterella sp. DM7]|uniref:outer membrane protein assembly factor BamB family protein n=1 Tax=Leadbetterella sp. DM7 TaxID=3235085 RepID=UPI00349E7B32